ncbi:MAG: ABC transporter ATP-binding protein [bacterium]
MKQTAVLIKSFVKKYGDFTAVANLNIEVKRGEIFGLLGPNGSGKTSTLECLEGLRTATSGEIDILGINPTKAGGKLKNIIGVQLQSSGLPASITPREAINLFSAYHNISPDYRFLKKFDLVEKQNTEYCMLSGGQQRRLSLIMAILHNPPIIILDEPTAALDVQSRVALHSIMLELKSKGTTIILATHDMAEAEKLADRVAVLLKGKIVALGTPKELTASGSNISRISIRTSENCLAGITEFKGLVPDPVNQEYFMLFSKEPGSDVIKILDYIKSKHDDLIDLRIERPSLEERFLELINPI